MIAARIIGPAPVPAAPARAESAPAEEEGAALPPISESDEAAYLAGVADSDEPVPPPAKPAYDETSDTKPLPDLDSLVARIPAGVREQLEDLFRAKFSKVTRVPVRALKQSEPSK